MTSNAEVESSITSTGASFRSALAIDTLYGEDVKNIELESLRDKFAYVFQDVFLFSNTIDSNIAYAEPDIEKEQVIEAAKHAHFFLPCDKTPFL